MPDRECGAVKGLLHKIGSKEEVSVLGLVCFPEDELIETFPDIFLCALADIEFVVCCFCDKVVEPAAASAYRLLFYGQLGGEFVDAGLAVIALYAVCAERVPGQADGGAEIHDSLVVDVGMFFI